MILRALDHTVACAEATCVGLNIPGNDHATPRLGFDGYSSQHYVGPEPLSRSRKSPKALSRSDRAAFTPFSANDFM